MLPDGVDRRAPTETVVEFKSAYDRWLRVFQSFLAMLTIVLLLGVLARLDRNYRRAGETHDILCALMIDDALADPVVARVQRDTCIKNGD